MEFQNTESVIAAGDIGCDFPKQCVEVLKELSTKIRRCLGEGAQGPLIVAADVIAVADNWDAYKSESGDLTFSQWIVGVCGPGKRLDWWRRRNQAVKRIGESARRKLDHEVAVYVAENVSDEHIEDVRRMLYSETKRNNGVTLTLKQARTRIGRIIGERPSKKQCANCRRLEALLRANGIDPDSEVH